MNKTILFLAANPSDTTRLRLDKEMREIKSGLERATEKFAIHQQEACRPKDVRRAMFDAEPGIVHFCGHGEAKAASLLKTKMAILPGLARKAWPTFLSFVPNMCTVWC